MEMVKTGSYHKLIIKPWQTASTFCVVVFCFVFVFVLRDLLELLEKNANDRGVR